MSKYTLLTEIYLQDKALGSCPAYQQIFKSWYDFIGEKVFEPTESDILDYIVLLKQKKGIPSRLDGNTSFSGASLNKYLSALRGLYRFFLEKKHVQENPFTLKEFNFSKLKKKNKKRQTLMVPFDAIPALLEVPSPVTKDGIRDRAFMACLFHGGLRVSEVASLIISDISKTYQGTLVLKLRNTKSGEDADHVIPKEGCEAIERLFEQRMRERASRFDPLFVSYRGNCLVPMAKPLHRRSLYDIFKFYCKVIGLDGNYSPHSGRASAITKALEQFSDHRKVQEFSRHSSVQMVEVYDKRTFGIEDAPQKELSYKAPNVLDVDFKKLARK